MVSVGPRCASPNLDIGNSVAEFDRALERYFVETMQTTPDGGRTPRGRPFRRSLSDCLAGEDSSDSGCVEDQ
jgi:hypothetical protein